MEKVDASAGEGYETEGFEVRSHERADISEVDRGQLKESPFKDNNLHHQ